MSPNSFAPRRRIGLLGFGAIGQAIAAELGRRQRPSHRLISACVRAHQVEQARQLLPPDAIVTLDIDDFMATDPDVVIEAAGQKALFESGPAVLARGCMLYILSVGALADDSFRESLRQAAFQSGSVIAVPSGALAGFDGLMAMRQLGISSVLYTSMKPPIAWRGTGAEVAFALDALRERVVIFRGSARDAALQFPRNANLAAAVALAGLGFEDTLVELVADPSLTCNVGRLLVTGVAGTLDVTCSTVAFNDNPKSSQVTGMSVVAALENSASIIRFA